MIYSIFWLFKSANYIIEYIYVILVITSLFAHYYIIIFSLILISYYQIGELYRKNIKWRRYWRSLPNVVITNYLTGHQLMREWVPEDFSGPKRHHYVALNRYTARNFTFGYTSGVMHKETGRSCQCDNFPLSANLRT